MSHNFGTIPPYYKSGRHNRYCMQRASTFYHILLRSYPVILRVLFSPHHEEDGRGPLEEVVLLTDVDLALRQGPHACLDTQTYVTTTLQATCVTAQQLTLKHKILQFNSRSGSPRSPGHTDLCHDHSSGYMCNSSTTHSETQNTTV